jgi:hypothetical protein
MTSGLKSNKGSGSILPLQTKFNYQNSEKFVYDDEDKCDLLNKYFSFISKSRNRIDKNNNIADLDVSIKKISDIIQILHANKAISLVNHGWSLDLTVLVLVEIHSLANSRNILVN